MNVRVCVMPLTRGSMGNSSPEYRGQGILSRNEEGSDPWCNTSFEGTRDRWVDEGAKGSNEEEG